MFYIYKLSACPTAKRNFSNYSCRQVSISCCSPSMCNNFVFIPIDNIFVSYLDFSALITSFRLFVEHSYLLLCTSVYIYFMKFSLCSKYARNTVPHVVAFVPLVISWINYFLKNIRAYKSQTYIIVSRTSFLSFKFVPKMVSLFFYHIFLPSD